MLSLLLSSNQAIGAFASIVNTHRAPLIAPNSQPYCGVRQHSLRESEKAQDVVKIWNLKNTQNSEITPQFSRQVDVELDPDCDVLR